MMWGTVMLMMTCFCCLVIDIKSDAGSKQHRSANSHPQTNTWDTKLSRLMGLGRAFRKDHRRCARSSIFRRGFRLYPKSWQSPTLFKRSMLMGSVHGPWMNSWLMSAFNRIIEFIYRIMGRILKYRDPAGQTFLCYECIHDISWFQILK